MRTVILALLAAWFAVPPVLACEVFEKLAALDVRLTHAYHKAVALPADVVLGKKKPGWQEFANIADLISDLESLRKDPNFAAVEPKLKELVPELRGVALQDRGEYETPPGKRSTPYAPTEYELLHAYQRQLAKLNGLLPVGLRYPIVKLPKDPRLTEVPEAARKLMREQEERVAKLFDTTGFADHAEFEKAVAALGPEGEALLKAFQDETVRIAIRRPNRGRFWIEKTGFHNQFVTKSSNGANDNDLRNKCESAYTAMPKDEYAALDPELKPQYAYVKPPEGSEWKENIASQYGDDIYIFKLASISDRLTFTPGDSLNRFGSRWSGETVTSWDHLMIPWKYRSLMIPFVWNKVRGSQQLAVGYQDPQLSGTSLKDFKYAKGVQSDYTEVQIFGGLRLNDVAEFHFTEKAPEGDFLKSLQERGIKIFDASGGVNKPTPWTPPGATP